VTPKSLTALRRTKRIRAILILPGSIDSLMDNRGATRRARAQVKGQAALTRGPASQSDPSWDTPDFTGQAYIPGSSLGIRIMKASVKKHSVVLGPLKTSIQPRR